MELRKSKDQKNNAPKKSKNKICKHPWESIHSALNNPLLIDNIIRYSIYQPNGKWISGTNVAAIRLVSKSWLQSTSRMLKQSSDSVITIRYDKYPGSYSLNGQQSRMRRDDNEEVLTRFVTVFSKKSRFPDSILSVNLILQPHNFIKEYISYTNNFLKHCSDMILELSVDIQSESVSRIIKCDNIMFDILRKIDLQFDIQRQWDRAPVKTNNYQGWDFLQEVLLNAKKLQDFTLWTNDDQGAADKTASLCSLPESIRRIMLCTPLTTNQMKLLTNNNLPNLEDVELRTHDTVPEEQLISKILDRFQSQLKEFRLRNYRKSDDKRDCIKFPFMKKLTLFAVQGDKTKIFPQLRADWPKLVPNLNCLTFKDVTESTFIDWTQGLLFDNIEKLTVLLCTDPVDQKGDTCSPNVHTMQELHSSFPHIQDLTLNFNVNELSGLPFLFQNLTTLKKLYLSIHGEADSSTGCKLVSIFLGISLELANTLTQKTNLLQDSPESSKSITNLKELTQLILWIRHTSETRRGEDIFFSSLLSKLGFEKLPKLVDLKLGGGFKPMMNHNR